VEPSQAVTHLPGSGAIEGFAIEPIPDALKTVRWPDLFLLVSNFLVNPSTILIGGLAVASGLSFWAAILCSTLGIVIAFSAYIIMATVGVDYGITGQVACRMVFGIRGAKWLPSVMRTIASAYWFAMQTIVGATVIVAIRHQWTGGNYSVVRTGDPGAGGLQLDEADFPVQPSSQSCRHCLFILGVGAWAGCKLPDFGCAPFSIAHWVALSSGRGLAEQHDRGVAHDDYRRRGFLPLYAQPQRHVVGHHAGRTTG
jgi:hypothetical protein